MSRDLEEYIEAQREADYAASETYRNEVREVAFPIVRDGIECKNIPHLAHACERGTCACDRIAHDIAERLTR